MHDLEHAADQQRRANKDGAGQGQPDDVVPGKSAEQDHQDAEGDEPAPVGARPPIRCYTGRRHRITHLDVLRSGCDEKAVHSLVEMNSNRHSAEMNSNRHSPDSGEFWARIALFTQLGANSLRRGQEAIEASKPAVDGGAILIHTVLPASRHTSPSWPVHLISPD